VVNQVSESIADIQKRFGVETRYFSFPFTTKGIPVSALDQILETRTASVLFGTSGLKKIDRPGLYQRIPMEEYEISAHGALRTEYLYYLLKRPFGGAINRY
jgi:hypothetical protein